MKKKWMQKLVEQLGVDWEQAQADQNEPHQLSEAKATLLHLVDTYSKYLIEIDNQPVKAVRDTLEELSKAIINTDINVAEKAMFRLRQFFNTHRIDEYTYIQKTFDDFKNVIWDFADQLGEEVATEKNQDIELMQTFEKLRDAVEANSIDELRTRSREFIDFYVSFNAQRDSRRSRRLESIQQNLQTVRQRLGEVTKAAQTDHLTGAFNRRSFDTQAREVITDSRTKDSPACMLLLDIDFFKRINDTFGHDVGDFVLKEFVRIMKSVFTRDKDFIARIGGEEFCVIMPGINIGDAIKKVEGCLNKIRKEAIVSGEHTIRFTASVGVAQLLDTETIEQWLKRADTALYKSKSDGRDRYTIAPFATGVNNVA